MSDTTNDAVVEIHVDNGASDAVVAVSVITLVILGAIHFIYTGGLPAWISHLLS